MLALSALLANSKAKASALVSTASDLSTADAAVPTHGVGTAASQKPTADPLVPPKLAVAFGQPITSWVKSMLHFYWLPRSPSLTSCYRIK